MSKLVWDQTGERLFETGVDRGVLFPIVSGKYQIGVAWNGLTAVNESPSGAEPTAYYADNLKYLNLLSAEDFGLGIEAYSYPPEFSQCIGESFLYGDSVLIGQQTRRHFGFSYRTMIGDDIVGTDRGYKLHIIFDCVAGTTEKSYSTINDSPEPIGYSWEVTTNPEQYEDNKPTAYVILDSTKFSEAGMANALAYIEDILYGNDDADSSFVTISKIFEAIDYSIYLLDSNGEQILDSDGNAIQSTVY